jgi:predicted cobalt transporter CbtA
MGRFLKVGALAGGAGGLALALFLRFVGEGTIGEAIAIERSKPGVHDEMFARGTQQLGGMVGAVLYGVFVGLIVAVVFAAVRHRMHGRDDWRRSVTLAAVGFVTIALVPFLKYPANPPTVGSPDTIARRTALYLLMVAWSVVTTWAAWRCWSWLRAREASEPVRATATIGLGAAMVAFAYVVLPGSPDAVEAPATLVWHFRMASLGGAAAFWTVLGLTMGALLVSRRRAPVPAEERTPVGAGVSGG